ncbi:MAG: lyase domain protein repeat-containing protein [Gemmatimonadetes bacterium]|nr:lyase domain protein repeat-containing protein [Gemmatimonadota bacterium]
MRPLGALGALAMTAAAGLMTLTGAASPAGAQTLRSRIEGAPDGLVRISYAGTPGICGNGEGNIHRRSGRDDGWERDCDDGPVRVALDVSGGQVRSVRTYVGGRWGTAPGRVTDLGLVSAPEAASYFTGLAERPERVKGDPILAAVVADSATTWPALLRIGRNPAVPRETRKQAVFWLSQEASDEATRGLAELAEDARQDQDVREQAVFALSQLPHEQGVPSLIKVARTNGDPEIRRKAIFWLGQSEDPRALALFEELLAGKGR